MENRGTVGQDWCDVEGRDGKIVSSEVVRDENFIRRRIIAPKTFMVNGKF